MGSWKQKLSKRVLLHTNLRSNSSSSLLLGGTYAIFERMEKPVSSKRSNVPLLSLASCSSASQLSLLKKRKPTWILTLVKRCKWEKEISSRNSYSSLNSLRLRQKLSSIRIKITSSSSMTASLVSTTLARSSENNCICYKLRNY